MAEDKEKQADTGAESGRGLGLLSLIVGLATGGAVYWITEHWLRGTDSSPAAYAVLQSTIAFSAAWLLLSERRDFLRPLIPAAAIAAILAAPTFFMISTVRQTPTQIDEFPVWFWFAVAAPLSGYLLLSLSKAMLESGFPPKYSPIYFHGLTLPLVGGGAALFAGLALILLFAWAALLKQMDVRFFSELFDEPWFILPFLGAIGGLSIAMIRGQRAVLGALRFVLLLFSRIAMPIMALFSITFAIALALKGPGAILDADMFFGRPAAVVLFLSFAGMLIFNGVYQNGEGGPPPAWLRISTLIAIALFPVYSGLSAYGLWQRIAEYGLTPPRIGGAAMTMLAFAYSLVLFGGLVTELNWRSQKWMPLAAPLNAIMAVIWIIVLVGLSSPLFNIWEASARSQERLLLAGKVAPADFDFGYLKFKLGAPGEASLSRIEASPIAQSAAVRDEIVRVRAAQTYWEYQNPVLAGNEAEPAPLESGNSESRQPGPMDLELNPADASEDE